MKERGFTLLEMIIGITLLGMLLALLYGGLRLATRGWDAGESTVERTARQIAVGDFLRRQLAQVYPLRWKKDTQDVIAFEGEANSLRFAAPISAYAGIGGIHLIALEQQSAGEDKNLTLVWRVADSEAKGFDFADEKNKSLLVRSIGSVDFSYFGSQSKDEEPVWQESWHSEVLLPKLIRIRIMEKDGRMWPDVLAELKLDAGQQCRWDGFYKKCM